jgi:hypothetical protein
MKNEGKEGRKLWNVKQTYRAYRRGFFEFPHQLGLHLTWSKRMAGESLNFLITGACFKKLPIEWSAPKTIEGLERLSKAASDWFEKQTIKCLSEFGIKGSRCEGRLRGHGEMIEVPLEVGEIDFLGYSERFNLLVIGECKLVENRMEPRFWKEDVAEFVITKKSYAEKFRKKIHWAHQNHAVLNRILVGDKKAHGLAAVMLTLSPSFAAIHIKDFPCVSLAEFTAKMQSSRQWPYQIGVLPNDTSTH